VAGQGFFSDAVGPAFEVPADLRTSEWAEQNRFMTRRQTSRPGQWSNDKAPPLAVVMNLCGRRTIRELWIMKAVQVGVSEAIRNFLGKCAATEPDPFMLVLPDAHKGKEVFRTRIIPLFEDTPCLADLLTGRTADKKHTAISLVNGFDLSLAWAGSPNSLASDPKRWVWADETDKFSSSSVEASSVALLRQRVHTYEQSKRSLCIFTSTPTIDGMPVAHGFDSCPVKLYFHGHCPFCGFAQPITFDSIEWEKFPELPTAAERAGRIRARGAAWLKCQSPTCGQRIYEQHKLAMLKGGYFGLLDGSWKVFVDPAGGAHKNGEEGEQPPEQEKVALHYPAEIDLEETWAGMAAMFVEADGRPAELQEFTNQKRGLPWAHRIAASRFDVYAAKCRPDPSTGFVPPPAKIVPLWASKLVMTVDSQKDYFWFVIRAWGQGFRSRRIHHGRAGSFKELEQLYYDAWWSYEGDKYPAIRCFGSAPLGIDSGGGIAGGSSESLDATRTDEIYQWCRKDPVWRRPLKGDSKPFDKHIRDSDVTYQDPGRKRDPYDVSLWLLDPVFFRDLLAGMVTAKQQVIDAGTGEAIGEVDQWELNDVADDEYCRHLSAVQKTKRRVGRGHVEQWGPKPGAGRHDYHDLESYQIAWAHGPANCFALPDEAQLAAMHEMRRAGPAPTAGMKTPDGRSWLPKR
jgi:phage terminase large subunit GpA-like protein